MRYLRIFLASALAAALVPAAIASAGTSASAAATRTVSLRHTKLGSLLVAPNGHTLYMFTRDRTNTDNCQHISECTSTWPPLVGTPRAGSGVSSKMLGTIRLKNGSHQITYAGHPLYTYSGDSGPGQTFYVGVSALGGRWYALNAKGATVR
jgi:predicted lipoprotein with Yx(FWY)xxD motif